MHYSISNQEKYNAVKKDVQDSIVGYLEDLFKKSHLVEVRSEGAYTFLNFELVGDSGKLQKETVFFSSKMFSVSK